jgi:hypothetical protein
MQTDTGASPQGENPFQLQLKRLFRKKSFKDFQQWLRRPQNRSGAKRDSRFHRLVTPAMGGTAGPLRVTAAESPQCAPGLTKADLPFRPEERRSIAG